MLQRLIFERIEQRILVGIIAFLAIMVLVGWIAINEGGRMATFDSQFVARSIERGASIFNTNCSECHGTDGLGTVGTAPALNSPYLFGYDYFADLDREELSLNLERNTEGTTPERITEIDARLAEIATERQTRAAQLQPAIDAPGDYDPVAQPSRLNAVQWAGSLRAYVITTLMHGRPNSAQYWPRPMVAWGQIAGGPLRQDQLEDLANYVLNWDKGSNWTIEDALAVRQFPQDVVAGGAAVVENAIAEPNTDPTTLDLDAIDAELANYEGDPVHGQELYNSGSLACIGCHGSAAVAPPMEGTWTRVTEMRLQDPANEGLTGQQYIAHSILEPNLYIAPGEPYKADAYPSGVMPQNFSGRLSYQDLADLVAFLMSQDQPLP